MSLPTISSSVSFLPDDLAELIGELFFVEILYSSCLSMWIPCIAVAAENLPTVGMKNICRNFYSNVSFIIGCKCIFDSPLMAVSLLQCVRLQDFGSLMVYLLGCADKLLPSLLLVVSRIKLVRYSEGVLKGFHKIPLSIQSKFVLPTYTLSIPEKFLILGIKRINYLAGIRKNDRCVNLFKGDAGTAGRRKAFFSLKKLLFSNKSECDSVMSSGTSSSFHSDDCKNSVSVEKLRGGAVLKKPAWIYSDVVRPHSVRFHCWRRKLCFEFLYDACSCLASSETIDVNSMAVHLEKAVFNLYGDPSQAYWEKIHDISSSIAGFKRVGTITPLLLDGSIPCPEAFVRIPRKYLYQSFLGESMDVSQFQHFFDLSS